MHNLYSFNKTPVFISEESFKQNYQIAKELRNYTNELLNSININQKYKNLISIGGESYLYGITNPIIRYITNYTNSKFIYNDVILNNKIYKKNIINYLIDYNIYTYIKNGDILIINNSKLNINLLKIINTRFYKYIIIINCHHIEFWNRLKYLNNYKLLKRKQFITDNYFVTVNLLKYKYQRPVFISLGNTCAIANQLNILGLRKQSYPFDWCKISLDKLNKVLENKFKNFSNIRIKKFSNKHEYIYNKETKQNINNKIITKLKTSNKSNSNGSYILTNDYNIEFAHELYINNQESLEKLKKTIDLRIERFIKLSHKKIIFIIFDLLNKNQLIKLINNLKKYFTIFKILYINIDNNYKNTTKICKNCNTIHCSINILKNYNFVKSITIDNNYINWDDWTHSKLDWFNIIFNN